MIYDFFVVYSFIIKFNFYLISIIKIPIKFETFSIISSILLIFIYYS